MSGAAHKILQILLVEDTSADVALVREMLNRFQSKYTLRVADCLSSALQHLENEVVDIVLLDLGLPDSSGLDALREVQQKRPELPIIVLTGLDDEELAAEAIALGAQDYLLKGNFDGQLVSRSMRYAVERKKLLLKLQTALAEIKQLSGLLPICAYCKKIKNDEGYWEQIETYIRDHSEVKFTHGLCPACAKMLYPEYFDQIFNKGEQNTTKET